MRAHPTRLLLSAAALLGLAAPAVSAPRTAATDPAAIESPAPVQGRAEPAPPARPLPAAEEPEYGPIRSTDPQVREQVRQLYRDRHELDLAARAELNGLVASLAQETDPERRLEIQRAAVAAKQELLLESMRLGLRIATLDGDDARAAEYEAALDRLLNPAAHAPAPVDPSAAIERARSLGLVE
jgi:hypothetical protein